MVQKWVQIRDCKSKGFEKGRRLLTVRRYIGNNFNSYFDADKSTKRKSGQFLSQNFPAQANQLPTQVYFHPLHVCQQARSKTALHWLSSYQ